jgi:hypothetical protein
MRLTFRFDDLVELRSFEGSRNVMPFMALQPLSIPEYTKTAVRMTLFVYRQLSSPVHGLPELVPDVVAAFQTLPQVIDNQHILKALRTVFQPHSNPLLTRSADLLQWYAIWCYWLILFFLSLFLFFFFFWFFFFFLDAFVVSEDQLDVYC